jgi:transcriptional regulator with XRE-family HTH domain
MRQSRAMNYLQSNIRRLLAERGLSQGDLATAAKISRPNLNRILQGKEKVTIERAERIAKALKISLPELLSENLQLSVA